MFILDIDKKILHRENCGLHNVEIEKQKKFSTIELAKQDKDFDHCHIDEDCIGVDEC